MSDYVQQRRKLGVSTPLGDDTLLLTGFRGVDAVSRPFRFRLELIAPNRVRVPFEAVLGQRLTVRIEKADGSTRPFHGLCCRFSQRGRDDEFTSYRAEVVPDLWLLSRKASSRIFQERTVPEILQQLLSGTAVRFDLAGKYRPRDFCVQYRETDLAFVSRLMEEEGIYYFFEHAEGSHTMVLADSPAGHPDLPGAPLIYEELAGGTRDEDRVDAWEKVQEVRSGKVVLSDHSFEIPHRHLEAESVLLETVQAGRETHTLRLPVTKDLELYDWPGEYSQRFDGVSPGGGERPQELDGIFEEAHRTTETRMDEEGLGALVVHGRSNVKHLAAGHLLVLSRHFSGDGPWVLLEVVHDARMGGDYRSGKEAVLEYRNAFTCIPGGVRYRPPRTTPRPIVHGSQTAVVVGPDGEEIFTDRYGRVKVRFHWDRSGRKAHDGTAWVRVSSSWAGRGWGAISIPRIGQEVVVDFLEGDPDQPIVIGSVYNAESVPPWPLPGKKTQSGLRTHSSKGGSADNYNEIRFEDLMGEEQIYVHAERDLDEVVERCKTERIGVNESVTVGNDRTETVMNDEVLDVSGNRSRSVAGTDSVAVGSDRLVGVAGNLATSVGGSVLDIAGADATEDVGANRKAIVRGREELVVEGAAAEQVGGERTALVGGGDSLTVGGDLATTVAGSENRVVGRIRNTLVGLGDITQVGGSYVVRAPLIALSSGSTSLLVTPGGIVMSGPMILQAVPPVVPPPPPPGGKKAPLKPPPPPKSPDPKLRVLARVAGLVGNAMVNLARFKSAGQAAQATPPGSDAASKAEPIQRLRGGEPEPPAPGGEAPHTPPRHDDGPPGIDPIRKLR